MGAPGGAAGQLPRRLRARRAADGEGEHVSPNCNGWRRRGFRMAAGDGPRVGSVAVALLYTSALARSSSYL